MSLPLLCRRFGAILVVFGLAGIAHASVIVSAGYYDLSPGQPGIWYGSPNTQFLGDAATATSPDPDEAAVLLQNTGSATVTLNQGFKIIIFGGTLQLWDSQIGPGGISISPGGNVILSGTTSSNMDLSEIASGQKAVVSFSIDGIAYAFVDNAQILDGAPSSNESYPWTQIGTAAAVPEPGTMPLILVPLLTIIGYRLRKTY